jgi:hypothetical protein
VNKNIIPTIVNGVQAGLLAQATEDDVALLWLTDSSKTSAVVAALNANKAQAHIDTILSGAQISGPASRKPDIIVLPEAGVIYASSTATKIEEHGGFSDDDTHVALLVTNPRLEDQGSVTTQVQTTQIAPTILQLLGLNPHDLQAVSTEGTQPLPDLTENG